MNIRYRKPTDQEMEEADLENTNHYLILLSSGIFVLQEKNENGEWEDVKAEN